MVTGFGLFPHVRDSCAQRSNVVDINSGWFKLNYTHVI